MTAPLSMDLRERLVRAVCEGSSIRAAARRFEVSPSAAIKLMRQVRETGSLSPARIGGYRRAVLEPHGDLLREIVAAKAGITLAEIQAILRQRGIVVEALSTISLMLRRLGLSYKKSRSARPSRTAAMWRASGPAGAGGGVTWTRRASSSSTRPAPRPT